MIWIHQFDADLLENRLDMVLKTLLELDAVEYGRRCGGIADYHLDVTGEHICGR